MTDITKAIRVLDIVDQEDGSATVEFDLDKEFTDWFCEFKNLEEFDRDVFQEWFLEVLEEKLKEGKNGL